MEKILKMEKGVQTTAISCSSSSLRLLLELLMCPIGAVEKENGERGGKASGRTRKEAAKNRVGQVTGQFKRKK